MLHVLIKTDKMGMRKAWFICPTENPYGEPAGVIVYKNNNKDRPFEIVAMDRIHLDIEFRCDVDPVVPDIKTIESARTLFGVNKALKRKSVEKN